MIQSFFITEKKSYFIVSIIAFLILVPGSFQLPLLDRDEPRFSRATVEMSERENWIIPYFNSEFRFDKPPLTYWWMGVHHWLLGNNEFSSRLHSIIATWLIALWMCSRGQHWVGPRGAVLGAICWLVNLQVWQHGRLALADMPMVLCVCLAMDGLWTCVNGSSRNKILGPFFLWFGISFGFLSKGPIAFAVPLLALIFYFLWKKETNQPLSSLRPFLGFFVSLTIISLWGIPALVTTDGLFAREGIGTHVVERGVSAFNDRSYTPFFYLGTFFLSFFPWWSQGKPILNHLKSFFSTKEFSFLATWFCIPFVLFSIYSTQLPHYLLPGFPALFLITGKGIEGLWITKKRTLPIFESLFSLLFLILYLNSERLVDPDFPISLIPWAFLILFCLAWIPYCLISLHKIRFYLLLIGMASSSLFLAREMRKEHLTIKIQNVSQVIPTDDIVRFSSSFAEPSLVYYLGGPWKFGEELKQDDNSSKLLFQVERFDNKLDGKDGVLVEGFNPARGKNEKVWVYLP